MSPTVAAVPTALCMGTLNAVRYGVVREPPPIPTMTERKLIKRVLLNIYIILMRKITVGFINARRLFFHNVSGMIDAGAARDDLRVAVLLAHVVRDSSLYSTMVMIVPMVNKIQLSARRVSMFAFTF